ncbi:thioredoxin family protein [Cryptosporidium andersoni]|uniref:Thioredoxin family protein n=1 Tax=Cryptosporidium andersoni TaxID=117008 RepID=A0A1J4MVD1_9CRYT|nr:thioredoxin family protein [Cryptosporidium andersoni]
MNILCKILYALFFNFILYIGSIYSLGDLKDHITNLQQKDFEEKVLGKSENITWFIYFFAPWCGHCQRIYPEVVKTAEYFILNNNIQIGKVDCTIQTEICKQEKIQAYPTFKLFLNESYVKKYEKPKRTVKDFIRFIESSENPKYTHIISQQQLDEIKAEIRNFPTFALLLQSNDDILKYEKFLLTLSNHIGSEVSIITVTDPKLVSNIIRLSISESCDLPCIMVLASNNESPTLPFNHSMEFTINFINQFKFPSVFFPRQDEFIDSLHSGNLLVIMGIDVKLLGQNYPEYLKEFEKLAIQIRKESVLPVKFSNSIHPRGIIFLIVDFVTYSSLFREFGINNLNYTQGYSIVISDGLKYYYNLPKNITIKHLYNAIKLILKEDPQIPKKKAYSIFSINSIRRFLYDLNVAISSVFYKSWYHAILVTIVICVILSGCTLCTCLLLFGDIAESHFLQDNHIQNIELQDNIPAPIDEEKSENETKKER